MRRACGILDEAVSGPETIRAQAISAHAEEVSRFSTALECADLDLRDKRA
jgi:hypothetical protein